MWNPVTLVAKCHNIEPASLVDFALSHESKYGIHVIGGDVMVSNFHSDDLVKDFETEQDEEMIASMEHMYPHLAQVDIGCEFDN